jgi:hypothetical protein
LLVLQCGPSPPSPSASGSMIGNPRPQIARASGPSFSLLYQAGFHIRTRTLEPASPPSDIRRPIRPPGGLGAARKPQSGIPISTRRASGPRIRVRVGAWVRPGVRKARVRASHSRWARTWACPGIWAGPLSLNSRFARTGKRGGAPRAVPRRNPSVPVGGNWELCCLYRESARRLGGRTWPSMGFVYLRNDVLSIIMMYT